MISDNENGVMPSLKKHSNLKALLLVGSAVALVVVGASRYFTHSVSRISENPAVTSATPAANVVDLDQGATGTDRQCFQHSFATTCEFRASDAGKTCQYNDECQKGKCIYVGSAESGTCDAYLGDEDGVQICSRRRGEAVHCEFFMS